MGKSSMRNGELTETVSLELPTQLSPTVCCFKIFVRGLVDLVSFGNLQSLVNCQLPEAQKP